MVRRLLVALALLTSTAAASERLLEVHFLDVGQGDAAFVRSPSGKTVLIDAGPPEGGPVIRGYLRERKVTGLDLVLASHPHLDHVGGLVEVMRHHRPRVLLDAGFSHTTRTYERLLEWLEAEKISVRTARGGRTITIEPEIILELLGPDEPFLSGTRSDANSNSIVARLVYREVSFLFTGDAENETEQRLLESGRVLHSTVLKVAHHGSRHSTSDRWLTAVRPTYAVVSAGRGNTYGHPTPQTLNRLANRGTRVFRTDRDGHVTASTDGRTIHWRASSAPESDPEAARIDLNTASAEALMTLPGIGPTLAERIVEERSRRGPFRSVDALTRVKGVGRATVERVRARAWVQAGGDQE